MSYGNATRCSTPPLSPLQERLLMHPGEQDSAGNMLLVKGVLADLYFAPDRTTYIVWKSDGTRILTTKDFHSALNQYNAINGSLVPYSIRNTWKELEPRTNRHVNAQAKALRDWMREHPDKVEEVRRKYGLD